MCVCFPPTCSVLIPGVAGEWFQAKVVERHVRTQVQDATGMQLLLQLLNRCAAARLWKKEFQDKTVDEKKTSNSFKKIFFLILCNKYRQISSHIFVDI